MIASFFVFQTVKVDDFLQDAEGLATLGLARSSSQLSFRVRNCLNLCKVNSTCSVWWKESAVEESEAVESTSQSAQEMSMQEDEEEEVAEECMLRFKK